jgi:hypothetical protein
VKVTPEVIEALRKLRFEWHADDASSHFNVLDNAGVFAEIDREVRLVEVETQLAQIAADKATAEREAEWEYINAGGM